MDRKNIFKITSGIYIKHPFICYFRLFEDNIDLLALFDKFKTLKTRDEQAQSLELAEHAGVVMNSIDEGIRAMDNADFFFELLHQIGSIHRKVPGFKKEYFWVRKSANFK